MFDKLKECFGLTSKYDLFITINCALNYFYQLANLLLKQSLFMFDKLKEMFWPYIEIKEGVNKPEN
jgi:hypothetical protein